MGTDFKYIIEKKVNGTWNNIDTAESEEKTSLKWMEQQLRFKYLPDFSFRVIPMTRCEKYPCFEPELDFEISDEARKIIEKEWYEGNIMFSTLKDIKKIDWIQACEFWDNYGINDSRRDFCSYYFVGYLYFINYCFKNMEIICYEELNGNENNIRILYWLC